MLQSNPSKTLTVVAPVFNEQANVPVLIERLCAISDKLCGWKLEVILVDDGSRDETVERIESLRASGVPVGLLQFSRNFGHQAAMQAGLAYANGDAVVTMDSDLQHPPEEIPQMLAAHLEGADIVQMVRREPTHGLKGMCSRGFYRMFTMLSGAQIIPGGADFRLLSKPVVEVLNRIPEREKFFRGLIPSLGFKQIIIEFDEASRLHGTPSFSFRRSLRLGMKALFDFSTVPLKFAFWGGLFMAFASFIAAVASILIKIFYWHDVEPGYTDIICAILFLSGTILAAVGIIGRYLMMILEQVRGRPAYIVMQKHEPAALSPAHATMNDGDTRESN